MGAESAAMPITQPSIKLSGTGFTLRLCHQKNTFSFFKLKDATFRDIMWLTRAHRNQPVKHCPGKCRRLTSTSVFPNVSPQTHTACFLDSACYIAERSSKQSPQRHSAVLPESSSKSCPCSGEVGGQPSKLHQTVGFKKCVLHCEVSPYWSFLCLSIC